MEVDAYISFAYYTAELHLKAEKKKKILLEWHTIKKRLNLAKRCPSQLYSVSNLSDDFHSVLTATGVHIGSAHLDLPEHALLLNRICFFRYELKISGRSEQLPSYGDLEHSFLLVGSSGLVSSVSRCFMVSGGSALKRIWWVMTEDEHNVLQSAPNP